jgi:S1-C subfamily serine protease
VTLAQGGRASVELLTVALTQSNPSEIGAKLDLTSVVPRIVAVVPNSAAAKAGLAAGDVITAINGAPVQGLNAFGVWVLIVDTPVGQSVRITVQRGGETKTFAPIAASE